MNTFLKALLGGVIEIMLAGSLHKVQILTSQPLKWVVLKERNSISFLPHWNSGNSKEKLPSKIIPHSQ